MRQEFEFSLPCWKKVSQFKNESSHLRNIIYITAVTECQNFLSLLYLAACFVVTHSKNLKHLKSAIGIFEYEECE